MPISTIILALHGRIPTPVSREEAHILHLVVHLPTAPLRNRTVPTEVRTRWMHRASETQGGGKRGRRTGKIYVVEPRCNSKLCLAACHVTPATAGRESMSTTSTDSTGQQRLGSDLVTERARATMGRDVGSVRWLVGRMAHRRLAHVSPSTLADRSLPLCIGPSTEGSTNAKHRRHQ